MADVCVLFRARVVEGSTLKSRIAAGFGAMAVLGECVGLGLTALQGVRRKHLDAEPLTSISPSA